MLSQETLHKSILHSLLVEQPQPPLENNYISPKAIIE